MTGSDRFRPQDLLAHADWARGLAGHLVRGDADADDLVQEAMVAAIRRPPLADRPLRPWFAAVLRKLALSRRRGEGRRARRDAHAGQVAAAASEPSAAEVAARLDAHRRLAEVVAELPEPLRGTVYLRYYEGLDSSEIARRQGVPAGTVRWRVAKALDELRAKLDARAGGDRDAWIAALAPIAAPRLAPAPPTIPAAPAALLSGVLVMGTMTKIALGVAAVAAAGLLLVATGVVPLPGGRSGGASPQKIEFKPQRPPEPAKASRKRAAAAPETETPEAARPVAATTPVAREVVVRARLVDSDAAPVRGGRMERLGSGDDAAAGADGRVALTLRPERAGLDLVVSADRCATRILRTSAARGSAEIDLGDVRLEPGGSVAGRVLDVDGAAVAGAWIGVADPAQTDAAADHWQRVPRAGTAAAPAAETGADGSFLLRGAPAGTANLWAGRDGFLPSPSGAVEVRIGEESHGVVIVLRRLDPSEFVQGTVVAPDGSVVRGATVSYRYEADGATGAGSLDTGEDGRFLVTGARDARWRVTARDPSGRWAPSVTQAVAPGGALTLRLLEPRWIPLVVTGTGGAPVARFGAVVQTREGAPIEALDEEARPDGIAKLRLPGEPFRVVVSAPGFAEATVGPIDPATALERIEARLTALPGVRGRVTLAGAPVAGAKVTLHAVIGPRSVVVHNGFLCTTDPEPAASGESRDDGSFDVTLRTPGRYVVRALSETCATAEAGPFDLDPQVGLVGVEVVAVRGGSIEGRVLVGTGRSPSGIVVGVSRGDGAARTVRTGADGTFRFERLTPGPWQVREAPHEIVPGTSQTETSAGEPTFDWNCRVEDGVATHFDLELKSDAACVVRGELRVDGGPASGWIVGMLEGANWFGDDGGRVAAVSETGKFRATAGRAGAWLVRAAAPAGLVVFAPVTLAEGENAWTAEVRTGRVEIRGAGERLGLVSDDGTGRAGLCVLQKTTDGAVQTVTMLAGRVRVVRPDRNQPDPRRWAALAEGELGAGGSLTLDVTGK